MFERMPYFMTNTDWFVETLDGCSYALTDKAPQEAIDSFNDYMKNRIPDEDIKQAWADMEKRLGLI